MGRSDGSESVHDGGKSLLSFRVMGEIPQHGVLETYCRDKWLEGIADKCCDIGVCMCYFRHDRLATVYDGDDVFDVTTANGIVVSSIGKGLQFCSKKNNRIDHPNRRTGG